MLLLVSKLAGEVPSEQFASRLFEQDAHRAPRPAWTVPLGGPLKLHSQASRERAPPTPRAGVLQAHQCGNERSAWHRRKGGRSGPYRYDVSGTF